MNTKTKVLRQLTVIKRTFISFTQVNFPQQSQIHKMPLLITVHISACLENIQKKLNYESFSNKNCNYLKK